ncbi:DNA polymerase III subunit delta [Luteolibacter sp. AS25]|uniref:DNA polymerase III subunit delta n=1 Tax=Luteolibacter sp. AS25 TaxID=3135776 RepID=UPI00398B3F10
MDSSYTVRVAATKNPTPMTANLHVIVGTDDGQVREQALKLYNKLTAGNDDGFTHETIDAGAENSEAAYQLCSAAAQSLMTMPMFGGDKVVWLRNVNFFGDDVTGRAQRTEAGVEILRSTLEKGLPEGIRFLISADKVDKRRAFWKWLSKNASLQVYDKIDVSRDGWQDEVGALVEKRATALGLDFTHDALELFIVLAGEQTKQIANELEKLDLFLGKERREVTEQDVRTLVPLSKAAVVFETGKAIQMGNVARAIQLVDEQLQAEESAIGIMRASIINVVRNLYMARLIMDKFKAPTGNYSSFAGALNKLPAAERAWLPQKKDGSGVNVYPIFLAVQNARNFDLAGLQHVMEETQKADQALVTTGLDHRLLLHRLIAEIAAARRKR